MKVEETEHHLIRIHLPCDGPWFQVSKREALQLAKDLLDACGEPEPTVFSGMTLDEIQSLAKFRGKYSPGGSDAEAALELIANLAARMKEQKEPIQVVITHGGKEETKPQPGGRIVCSCGRVYRYIKRVCPGWSVMQWIAVV